MTIDYDDIEFVELQSQLEVAKDKLYGYIDDSNRKIQFYLNNDIRGEIDYRNFCEAIEKRNRWFSILAELRERSFSVPATPTFEEFQKMTVKDFDVEVKFYADNE